MLAEEPMQSLHREHGELPPEPPTLPQPVSMTSFNGIIQVWSGRKLHARGSRLRQMESEKAKETGAKKHWEPGSQGSWREHTERVELSPKRALKLGVRGSEPAVSSARLPVP